MGWCCFKRVNHRAVLCGRFNVAIDFYPGAAILLAIPPVTLIYLSLVMFGASVLNQLSYECVLLFTCIILLTAATSEITLAYLFLCDPGFTTDTNEANAHLCPVCKLYVHDFDHHCNILGVCIGARNMGFFVSFLTAISAHLALLSIFCVVSLIPLLHKSIDSNPSLLQLLGEVATFVSEQRFKILLDLRALTVIALLPLLHGTLFSGMMCAVYWFFVFKGKYSLERRRKPWISGSVRSVFSHMRSTELAERAISRIAKEIP